MGTVTHTGNGAAAAGRRFGYVVAVAINGVLLWVVHQLLDWQWPRFLTEDFEQLLPIVSLSFVASMIANALFVLVDPPWFKALAGVVTSAISLAVSIRTWQVFPFDFSTYAVDWSTLVRVLVALGIVGSAIATLVNLINVPRSLLGSGRRAPGGVTPSPHA